MKSIYEYGSRAGFWRLWRMFTARKIPATVFGVATALKRNPEVVAAMNEAGWDIASHGLKWIEHKDMPEAEERPISRKRSASTPRRPGTPARLVHRPLLDQHDAAGDGGGRIPLSPPTPMPTICPTGSRGQPARI